MTVKKLKVRGHATDKYYCMFRMAGVPVRVPLLESRDGSLRLSRLIESALDARRAGAATVTTPELLAAIQADHVLGKRLVACGLLPAGTGDLPVDSQPATALVDEWHAALSARATASYVDMCAARVRKVLAGMTLSGVRRTAVELRMAEFRAAGMSARTANFHGASASQYMGWLVEQGKLAANPLVGLHYANAGADKRHERRPLSDSELEWLLKETAVRDAERALVYRLAVETGLRCGEIRALTARRFTFGIRPTVTVTAASAKNRTEATLPLRPDTAAVLQLHLGCKLPDVAAFKMPTATQMSTVLRRDLQAARDAWLARQLAGGLPVNDEFLAYKTADGKFADFHSLRHTFVTRLSRAGANIKTIQRLARHSKIDLTMGVYAHAADDELAGAVATLPAIGA